MTRGYIRLPDDETIILAYEQHGRSLVRLEAALGWSRGAVSYRLRKLGILTPRPPSPGARILALERRNDELTAIIASMRNDNEARMARLETHVRELLDRPTFQPTHRRKADGGVGGRTERRRALHSA